MANEVKLKLAIEGGQVVSATLDGVSTKLDGVDRSARGASGGVGQLKSVMAGIVTVGAALEILRMADACTSLRTNLLLSSNGAAEAQVAYQRLYEIAQQSRVGFTALGDTYATIARAGRELGVSQDRLLTVTQAIGMAMTIGGGSAQSMQAALVQLGQGLSSGTLRGEELNSILEQTPRLARALADGMGVSVGQLRALSEQGKITADAVISALEKSAPQLAKEMSGAAMTVGQAYTMLTNSVTKFVGEADTASGASGTVASALQGVAGAVDTVGSAINNHSATFSIVTTGLAGAATAAGITSVGMALYAAAPAVVAFGAAWLATPLAPIILALAAVAAGIAMVKTSSDQFARSEVGLGVAISDLDDKINRSENTGRKLSDAGMKRIAEMRAERTRLQAELALQANGQDTSSNAKEMKRLQEKSAEVTSAYAGAKPLDEVRKMVKTRNSILIEANDQAVNIAKAFNKSMASAASPADAIALSQERDQLLIANAQETTAALKSFDDQRAAPAKAAAKQRLDSVIQYYEAEQIAMTAGQQRASQTLAAQHSAGLVTDQAYYLAKRTMAEADNAAQQTLIQREIEAVKQSGLSKQDQAAQLDRFNQDLKRLREAALGIESAFSDEMMVLGAKWRKEQQAADQKANDQLTADIAKLSEANAALSANNQEIGLNAEAMNQLRLSRLDAAIQTQRGIVLEYDQIDATTASTEALVRKQLEVRKLAEMEENRSLTAVSQIRRLATDTFQSAFESADRTAHDVFVNIFNGGQDVFTKLRDVAKATFLDWLYQMTVRKWIFNITAVVSGTSVAQAATGSGAASAVSSAANLGSTASSAMSWITDFGGSVTDMAERAGSFLMDSGSTVIRNIGEAMFDNAASVGQYAQYAGDAVGYINALVKASEGKWGAAIGSALGTYFGGPIGSFIGNTIGSWIDNAFGGGHEYSVANGIRVHAGADGMSSQTFDQWRNDGSSGIFGIGGAAASSGVNFSATDDKVSKQLNDNYTVLKAQTMAYTAVLGLNTDAIKGYTADMQLNLTNMNPQEIQAAVTKMFTDIADGMAGQVLDPKYVEEGETASVALKRMGDSLMAVNGVFTVLNYKLMDVSAAGGAAASGLVSAMGGLQAFQSQMMSYYQNYYSPEEQRTNTINSVVGNLDKAGIHFTADQISGASRADIRAVVEQYAARVDTDAGQKQYAEVVKAANLLTSVTPATTATQQKVEQVGSSGGGGGGGGGASSAVDHVKSALQQYTDAIFGEVKRLRGLMEGTGQEAYAAAQSRYEITRLQALAGSQEALKSLPALSQNLVTLAESNVTSYLDLQRVRSRTAASLADTGTQIATRHGLTVPAFASGGDHAGGWAMVGERGPELAYMPPARIYNADQTRSIVANGGGSNADLAAALRAMAERLDAIEANTEAGAIYGASVSKMLARVIPDDDEEVIAVKVVVPKGGFIPMRAV